MSTPSQPSAGAIRAAKSIGAPFRLHLLQQARIADIIEEQTHAGELAAALERILNHPYIPSDSLQCCRDARAVLAKVGGAKP